MAAYILNALSLNMFSRGVAVYPRIVPLGYVPEGLWGQFLWTPAMGHADAAEAAQIRLREELPGEIIPRLHNRIDVKLSPGDVALVAQYTGPRLPEGTTSLPEGAKLEWWLIEV